MKTNLFVAAILAIVLSVSACNVAVADSPPPFTIATIFVSGSGNFHFRVFSNTPSQALCTGGPVYSAWAYVEDTDSGANTKITALLLAYTLGKTIQIWTENVVGFCHIMEFTTQ